MTEEEAFVTSLTDQAEAMQTSPICQKLLQVIDERITTKVDLQMIIFECTWRLVDLEAATRPRLPWQQGADSKGAAKKKPAKPKPQADLFQPGGDTHGN